MAESRETERPLAGKVALVTGAGSGIGRACALALARAGAALAAIDRSAARAAELTSALPGTECLPWAVDLADARAVDVAAEAAIDRFGRVDILVNCAGAPGEHRPLTEVSDADWEQVFAVNVRAPFVLMRRIGAHMVRRGDGGRIVSVSSSSAHRAVASRAPYGSSKAALEQLTRSAAAEFGRFGINVNAVAPGVTDTPWTLGMGRAAMEQAVREGPLANLLHRVSTAEDVAAVVLFLCLPASRQITGQTIHASAGAVV